MKRLALAAALGAAAACRSPTSGQERPIEAQAAPTAPRPDSATEPFALDAGVEASAPTQRLEPLAGSDPLVALEVPGFRAAHVSLPLGATGKRPIVVALHGNYDRPEWQCEVWREITRGYPFVLCPRGIPRDDAPKSEDRWHYGAQDKVDKEMVAGVEALVARHPNHVDREKIVFTGFSLGAIIGKNIVTKHAGTFHRAVYTEGGYEGWSAGRAKQTREAGVERVLFACGQSACVHSAKAAQRLLEKEGVPTHIANGGNIGHTYDGPVAAAIVKEWAWLLEGDERWK